MIRQVPLDRLDGLQNLAQGLTSTEVNARFALYGGNQILEVAPGGWWQLLLETLKDPMLWFLLGTSVVFGLVGQRTEAAVLLAALLPLLGMDAYLLRRTRASIEGLSSRLTTSAVVLRDGTRQTVESTALVPGDLALVKVGEAFPADGLVVDGKRIQVDESTLTGEAFPVHKQVIAALPTHGPEARVEGIHWGLAGTRLLTGEAWLRVIYTGGETLYGEIVRSATRGQHGRTPLQEAVASLVRYLLVAAGLVCLVLAGVRLQQGHGVLDALLSAVTLAIAALPEEFPVVLTFFLGVGVYRLAKRKALVRRAIVVENIGRVTCICTDKTGTITEGRLLLTHQLPADGATPARLIQIAAAASRDETGDPMDQAIIALLDDPLPWQPVKSFPFTEDRKRETAILRDGDMLIAAVKGAPEVIFLQCAIPVDSLQQWQARVEEYARSGHKVIACAWREVDARARAESEPDQAFHLAGLLAFEDPMRAGVREALLQCRNAGIHVIMVTGDHPATARAIAVEVGLGAGVPCVIEGDAMAARFADGERSFLRDTHVIARAVPAQKLSLVRSLQADGEIVAVTGDGVNDVPALQAADIGIAMGERGTRSAREVAAIVLLDDDFSTIVRAIAEGQQLFTNLQLSFTYLLMLHLPLVLTAALIPLAGYPLLYLPIHVVWLELIIHPTALLVFQNLPLDHNLAPTRRTVQLKFFGKAQWLLIATAGTVITAIVAYTYIRSLGSAYDVEHARAMALVTLTAASAGITASLSGLRNGAARIMVLGTLLLSLVLVQTPNLASLLHLKPLHFEDWLLALGGGLVASLIAALAKFHPRAENLSATDSLAKSRNP